MPVIGRELLSFEERVLVGSTPGLREFLTTLIDGGEFLEDFGVEGMGEVPELLSLKSLSAEHEDVSGLALPVLPPCSVLFFFE